MFLDAKMMDEERGAEIREDLEGENVVILYIHHRFVPGDVFLVLSYDR